MSALRVRLALLSDLHAYHPEAGRSAVSYLPTTQGVSDPDPFGNLEDLIKREALNVNFLICAGDICDKADFRGFQYAWGRLNALKESLGATQLIATCGNHDLNSRHIDSAEDPDPKGALQTVQPQFPFVSDELTNQFWARNFAFLEPLQGVRFLVLNTSAYHGGSAGEEAHGRVSRRTIDAIRRKLAVEEQVDLNVLLCHHHVRPLKGLWQSAPDAEFMQKGGELLSMLTSTTASPWLVLHGHRHIPNLEHSRDPDCVVVGASSFSGQIPGKLNQFHILEIIVDHSVPQPLTGTIETWSWTITGGWQKRPIQNDEEGFPPQCGFGSQFQPRALAEKIAQILDKTPDYKSWEEVAERVPDVNFMTPTHLSQVEKLLEAMNIKLHRDREGMLTQVGRSA
ncbi:3',5'-cyclic adenosine monophosphate phosphodiesterase CpdA [Ralstonia edaphis]|uniref:3',5'-cyclic adenosine monophosphate phosphodiesterase CpdA n=1 Tax=Ralstonia edaphi TaxID=3058599 RepID=A0AB72XBI1_9RALS|nr:metallophosphoesterase [Ralstonia sp. LMG 6871]CAJ0744386.1 3',5'-cyclic adenosine monophosphate phosphodiesterase CpdA [Ralstonia sp. LMG 6871]